MVFHDGLTALPLHLLRLVSQSLPVGAFSYSRGLEWAVSSGMIRDENSAQEWIIGTLEYSYAVLDGALFWRMAHALKLNDHEQFLRYDTWLGAGRESRELASEDRRMAEAFLRLLLDLDVPLACKAPGQARTYPAMFAIASHHWRISPADALKGLMFSVVEAQVAAAIRLVPLGHTAGQRILIGAIQVIERAAETAISCPIPRSAMSPPPWQ
ncbi:urease accessory protein UreF [Bradyrhizobium sp. RDM12]